MKYLIVAHDGEGEEARALRQAVRPRHLRAVETLVAQGRVEVGGALLDEAGAAVGSMMVVDFASRRELDAYLEREPYRAEGVWREITVTPMNRVV